MEVNMTINKNIEGSGCTLEVAGRLDTMSSPEFEKKILEISDCDSLIIDCSNLEYISSAGLRIFLTTHKAFSKKGGMVLKNVKKEVLEVLEVTGFTDFLKIE